MSLKETIKDDMKQAMRDKDTLRLSTIRMLLAEVKKKEIDEQITLDDVQLVALVQKMIKQRRESFEQYQKAERPELADKEQAEIAILGAYLPPQMSEVEVKQAVQACVQELGAVSKKDMGKVMAAAKSKLQGAADMGVVRDIVQSLLQ